MGCLFTVNWNSDTYCLSRAGCRQFRIVFLSLHYFSNNVFPKKVLASANHTKYVHAANLEACAGSGNLWSLWSIKNFMGLHFLFSEDRPLIDWSSEEAGGLWVGLGHAKASQLHLLAEAEQKIHLCCCCGQEESKDLWLKALQLVWRETPELKHSLFYWFVLKVYLIIEHHTLCCSNKTDLKRQQSVLKWAQDN